MPSIPLHARRSPDGASPCATTNHLPTLLHTPSGLAVLEIQGTIHAPFLQAAEDESGADVIDATLTETPIGKLEFPHLDPKGDPSDLKWMKRVYLYVGKHQRLTGEVKKLAKPVVVVSKRAEVTSDGQASSVMVEDQPDQELEILEVIKYKILFGGRPEPVGS